MKRAAICLIALSALTVPALADPRVGVEIEIVVERARGVFTQRRIGERSDGSAPPEHVHRHAETVQRLTELEPDDAGTEHRHAARQIIPGEHVIVHDEPIAGAPQDCGHARR